ncbi:hypothetical protein Ahy_A04g019363 [Arachis hypogaea]|uniref:Protein FAR1-RELATED SEQUENCE n=1 Tax=Arachis hypogaea TaxID=3818 RepID=A0A445DFZ5_ARAHY|nr:hypothetical protein Ahy_A04g019363 [Arachis hypogaea]
MKEKKQNFFFELNLEGDHSIKHALWADARSTASWEYFGGVVSFDTTYNINRYSVDPNSVFTCIRQKLERFSHKVQPQKQQVDLGSVHSAELYKNRHIWIPVYLDHHF